MTIANNWPEGDGLTAAARRGNMIREMLRHYGYHSAVSIVEDILASVEVARIGATAADEAAGRKPLGIRHDSARSVGDTAAYNVEIMAEVAAIG